MTETALVPLESAPFTWKALESISDTEFVPRGLRGNPSAMLAAIYTGRELGLGPMASLRGIDMIEGAPHLSGETLMALIRRAGHRVRVTIMADNGATVVGERVEGGVVVESGEFSFTEQDAERAGLLGKANWRTYPQSMYAWRAVTICARFMFADLLTVGRLAYTADELGDDGPPEALAVVDAEVLTADPVVEVGYIPDGEPWPDEPPADEPAPSAQPPTTPPAKKAPPATAQTPKCPACGSAVQHHDKEDDDDKKPIWKCSNSTCQGGADKKPPAKGKWPWASWDTNCFAQPRTQKSEPEAAGPFDVQSAALAEAERLIKGAARIIREGPVGKVEQHVGALAGALVMADWWPEGIVESSLKLFAAHLRGSPAKFPGCQPDELKPGAITRWDQLGSDKNIRLFAGWIVREAAKRVAHQRQQPAEKPKVEESLWPTN